MQDRYAGDVGDFSKYGLLRALARGGLQLGVIWYLVPDERHNGDGRHVGYLDGRASYRDCDPQLYDALARMVREERRSVAATVATGILPAHTLYHDVPLCFDGIPAGAARRAHRKDWLEQAVRTTEGCDVVFVDPDNGLECDSVGRHAARGPKYCFVDELAPYVVRDQTVAIYHHTNRTRPAAEQVADWATRLRGDLERPCHALLFRRGSVRAYFVLPAKRHEAVVEASLRPLLEGPWAAHFSAG